MLIAGVSSITATSLPSVTQRPGSSGFSVPDATPGPGTASDIKRNGMATPISGSMMLALQERNSREQSEEEARRHGRRLLDELVQLQRALLSGSGGVSLQRLEELAGIEPGDVDPALAGVLSSIRLRARIELARRTAGRTAV